MILVDLHYVLYITYYRLYTICYILHILYHVLNVSYAKHLPNFLAGALSRVLVFRAMPRSEALAILRPGLHRAMSPLEDGIGPGRIRKKTRRTIVGYNIIWYVVVW